MTRAKAQGRLKGRTPIAVVDIGSNSVRLVVYEGLVRSPTVLFNEKVLAGLGKGLVRTGELDEKSVELTLRTLARFRALCKQVDASQIYTLATAAAREAKNGPEFIARAEEILQAPIRVLTGKEEATYSAFGIISSFHHPDGIVGDMGGGSLELVNVSDNKIGEGVTLPLGGLRLGDMSDNNRKEATKIARRYLRKAELLTQGRGRNFYAVGGTWRNLAKLHMAQNHYPLPVMHGYELDFHEADSFLHRVAKGDMDKMPDIETVSKSRRQLLPFGAAVMIELMHVMRPNKIVFSGSGVREGFLYSLLPTAMRKQDPLLAAAEEMSVLRARSPLHANELIDWTGKAFRILGLEESEDERRYREAICMLSDIGWRINPDYRGIQAANQIAYGVYPGIDHPGRVFAALSVFFRNEGLVSDKEAPAIISLASPHIIYRARVLGAVMRISNLFCASNAGILPETKWRKTDNGISLGIPAAYETLISERPEGRLQQLAKLVGINMKFKIID